MGDANMGLTDDGFRARVSGAFSSFGRGVAVSTLISAIIWGFAGATVRGVNAYSSVAGFELIPAVVMGITYVLLSMLTMSLNGGFVYWSHMLMLWIVGSVSAAADKGHTGADGKKYHMYSHSNKFVQRLNIATAVVMTLTTLTGLFIGVLLAWGVTDGYATPAPNLAAAVYKPGPFPGPSTNFNVQVAMIESIGMFVICLAATLPMLWNRADLSAMCGGLAVAVFTGIGFNISGGAFDFAWYTMMGLTACISGPCFGGPTVTAWWWTYLFSLVGAFVGVLVAVVYFASMPMPAKYEEEMMLLPPSARNNSGFATQAQAAAYAGRSDALLGANIQYQQSPAHVLSQTTDTMFTAPA